MNETKTETTLRLFGNIGSGVDGDRFANDLAVLDGQVDTINLHINSPGGDVSQGYSIISVMLSMKTPVNVYVVGVAASIAAVIAICGKKVYMYDYSRLMIHNPYIGGVEFDKLTEKDKTALTNVSDSLNTILSRRGKNKKEIARMMEAETWLDAAKAKANGLIDEVISTQRKEEFNGMPVNELFSRILNEHSLANNLKTNKMDFINQLAKILNLTNPTEKEITQKVKDLVSVKTKGGIKDKLDNALRNKIINQSSYNNLLEMGDKAPEAFNNYFSQIEASHKAEIDRRFDAFMEMNPLKAASLKSPDIKNEFRKIAHEDFARFELLMRAVPKFRRVMDDLVLDGGSNLKSNWTLADYRKNAPNELKKDPQLYQRLLEEEREKNNNNN